MKITSELLIEMGIHVKDVKNIIKKSYNILEPPIRIGNTTIKNVKIGGYTYIRDKGSITNVESIGRFCSIATGVTIGLSEHPIEYLSTNPFQYDVKEFSFWEEDYKFKSRVFKENKKSKPFIGNDVWIGANSLISRGVRIGDGAIIAAGAVVTKDVKPYEIVGGVPAKHIKFRFNQEIINKLLEIKWWRFTHESLEGLDFSNITTCIDELETRIANKTMKKRNEKKVIIKNHKIVNDN